MTTLEKKTKRNIEWDLVLIGTIVIFLGGIIMTIILLVDAHSRRVDDLQKQCIAGGGNWDYGCEMRPERE